MSTVGLIIGHTPDEPGAANRGQQISEWHYNSTLVRMVNRRLDDTVIILRGRPNDWDGLPRKVNETGVDFAVSFHLNAYKGDAKGSETLYWHSSSQSRHLAEGLQEAFVSALGTSDRGVKPREEGDRGWTLLKHTTMPIVICEPFFIDDGLAHHQPKTADLADAYTRAIIAYRGNA